MGRVSFGRGLLGFDPVPSSDANRTRDRGQFASGGEAGFDTNMVIILAALLFALIAALGLNSLVRCALHCSRRLGAEAPERAATGVKKRVLRKIPLAVYGAGGASFPATDCPICLTEFEDGEKVRVLPRCNHAFHVRCIDTWFASHSSCPNCRHSLLELPGVAAGAAQPAARSDRDGGVAIAEETN